MHMLLSLVPRQHVLRMEGSGNFKEWFSLVLTHCIHFARFDILSSFFSETKGKTAQKTTAECFTTK